MNCERGLNELGLDLPAFWHVPPEMSFVTASRAGPLPYLLGLRLGLGPMRCPLPIVEADTAENSHER